MKPKTAAVIKAAKRTLWDEFVKWAARLAIWAVATVIAAIFVNLLTPWGEQVAAVWRAPEAIAQVQVTQEAIRADLSHLRQEVSAATGEDRVIRQPPGQSYIEEPVHAGSNVVMIMAVERTTLGRDCRLSEWIPLFTDGRNVTVPGQRARAGPVRRQIGDDLVRLRIEMIPPPELLPGRVEVYLSLEYDCAGSSVLERSDVVSYTLLPSEN